MSSSDPTASAPDRVAEEFAPAAGPGPSAPSPRPSRRVRLAALAVLVSAVALIVALAAGRSGGGSDARASGTSVASQAAADGGTPGPGATADAQAGSTTAEGEVDPLAPLPKSRAKVVAPVAGEATEAKTAADGAQASPQDDLSLPTPKGPATKTSRSQTQAPAVRDLSVDKATALPNGVALPPLEAPEAVLQVIRAGNTIARTPYKWGGGHGSFKDNGYDCSGSVSFALFSARLIEGSRTSGGLMSWGQAGKGRWITVYANGGHTFMEVAGIRFDTSGRQVTGSRWQNEFRSTAGFVARHPAGL